MPFLNLPKATYELTALDVTDIGGAVTDIANSIFGIVADLLPILVPLIVVYFGIRMVLSRIR